MVKCKTKLYLMMGCAGSGKSTYLKTRFSQRPLAVISRDEIRFSMVKEDEEYFSHENEVYAEFIQQIKDALDFNTEVFADATHLNWKSRQKLLKALASKVDMTWIDVIPVVVTANLETCLKRNSQRTGRAYTPESVIRRMSYQLTDPAKDNYKYKTIWYVTNEEELKVEHRYV